MVKKGHVWSKETLKKRGISIAKSLKGKCSGKDNNFYGKKHSEKSKKQMSETTKKQVKQGLIPVFKKGYKQSEESKRKQSETRTGLYCGENSPRWRGGRKRYYQKKARDMMIAAEFNVNGLHVHHINGNVKDNRLENFKLLTPEEHGKIHSGVKGKTWSKT